MTINLDNVNPSEVTKQIVDERIEEGNFFSIGELEAIAIKQGGNLEIFPGVIIEDYLNQCIKEGIVEYSESKNMYHGIEKKVDESLN
jgi:hypothetical protein